MVLGLLAAACGGGDDDAAFDQRSGRARGTSTTTSTTDAPATTTTASASSGTTGGARPGTTARRPSGTSGGAPAPAGPVNVKLTQIARLNAPLDLTGRPGEPGALYVAEKGGRVRVIRNGTLDPNPVFNLSGEVSTGSEQGLLGMAFNPSGSHLYVNITNRDGDTRILELAMNGGARRQLLAAEQPAGNHNGGGLAFGPDGRLYIALGDGGGGNDTYGNGQNLSEGNPLAKLLRMNVADGSWDVRAYGLRNPFRFSFDRANGDIWIGDVGQNAWEEVSKTAAGEGRVNFGWSIMEGNHRLKSGNLGSDYRPPVYEYSHDSGGCSVTGGFIYRGSRIPGLVGTYVFADVCIGDVWGLAGGARRHLGPEAQQIVSFGQDLNGELYAVSLNGPVYRIDPA